MKNIHVLATDQPSRLHLGNSGLVLCDLIFNPTTINAQHIYITSDEEIKEGDWHLVWLRDKWEVLNYMPSIGYRKECLGKEVCKIILTTDSDLIKDGVQAIDDDFLEWFVKNPSCEWVEVADLWKEGTPSVHDSYQIIIPKEENSIEAKQRAANYMSLKGALDSQYVDFSNPNADKITSASTTTIKEEPKQETLEEAAKEHYSYEYDEDTSITDNKRDAFIEGAKWQQEQILQFLYSEIIERRPYSSSKMCEVVIEFIEQLNTKK